MSEYCYPVTNANLCVEKIFCNSEKSLYTIYLITKLKTGSVSTE